MKSCATHAHTHTHSGENEIIINAFAMCHQKTQLSTNTARAIIRVHFQPILPVIYCDLNALNT